MISLALAALPQPASLRACEGTVATASWCWRLFRTRDRCLGLAAAPPLGAFQMQPAMREVFGRCRGECPRCTALETNICEYEVALPDGGWASCHVSYIHPSMACRAARTAGPMRPWSQRITYHTST